MTSGRVRFPLVGAWVATLALQSTAAPAVGSPAVLDLGGVPFVGSVASSEADAGRRVTVRVVGGANGLGTQLEPQGYYRPTRRTVVVDALTAGGETLSPLSDATLLDASLGHWSRFRSTVAETVRRAASGATHRVLPDGTVWVGSDVWAPIDATGYVVEQERPTEQRVELALETALVLPGASLRGQRVTDVVYTVGERKLRAQVTYGETRGGLGTLLDEVVSRRTAATDLHALYVATVRGQNGDGTVELAVADGRFPSLSRVPVRLGGVSSVRLVPGTAVLLGHEDGREDRPVVVQAYQAAVQSLEVTAVESVRLTAPRVEAGGAQPLVLHTALAAWVSALTTAAAPLGLSVPPLVGAATTVTGGA